MGLDLMIDKVTEILKKEPIDFKWSQKNSDISDIAA
jgi:hypothetical protein